MRTERRSLAFAAALLPLLAAPLAAVDPVPLSNGGFDTDLAHWDASACDPEEPEECIHLWTPLDRHDSPDSGSVRLLKNWAGGSNLGLGQCISAAAFRYYSVRAQVFQATEDVRALAYVQIQFFDDEACTLFLDFTDGPFSTQAGAWSAAEVGPLEAPDGTESALVRVVVYEQQNETAGATATFDEVAVGIFFGDFEVGDLSEWTPGS